MSTTVKTREEIIASFQSEFIELVAMVIDIEGYEEVLEFSQAMENPPQKLHFILPESSTYHLSIRFKVTKRPLKNLKYYQVVKKHGLPFKTRDIEITPIAEVNNNESPEHVFKFPPDTLPGGALIRGKYPAQSKFYEDGKEIFACDWIIEIVKKHHKPSTAGHTHQ